MKENCFLAFDIGASSGRAILGTLEGGRLHLKELLRFPNAIMELHGRYHWDIYSLYASMKEALKICAREKYALNSIGIDTWGVDFGYIAEDGSILGLPRAYRDPYTVGAPDAFFQLMPREELYQKTGIQIMNINSLFQLFCAKGSGYAPYANAEKILFMPDLLAYLLTGKQVCEYTEASTSQMINPATRCIDGSVMSAAGLDATLLHPLVEPGTIIGPLTPSLAEETGVGAVPVVTVAGHDTASAVLSVPAENPHFAYLSSGTWSLMGIETEQPIITSSSYKHNFTNEGGVEGTTRFLKNMTGMWLLEQCRKEWEREGELLPYAEMVQMAVECDSYTSTFNPDDPRLAHPGCMTKLITTLCEEGNQPAPTTEREFVRCIFNSLVNRYCEVLGQLREMAPFPIERLHIIGGGSQNSLINQLTADATGLPVMAGPSEATAIGNCMMQAKAAGLVADRWAIRKIVAASFPMQTFFPT